MKYLIEIDSLQNLSYSIKDYLELMVETKFLDGEIDCYPDIEVKTIEED